MYVNTQKVTFPHLILSGDDTEAEQTCVIFSVHFCLGCNRQFSFINRLVFIQVYNVTE